MCSWPLSLPTVHGRKRSPMSDLTVVIAIFVALIWAVSLSIAFNVGRLVELKWNATHRE